MLEGAVVNKASRALRAERLDSMRKCMVVGSVAAGGGVSALVAVTTGAASGAAMDFGTAGAVEGTVATSARGLAVSA
jgi:hypothetical protein